MLLQCNLKGVVVEEIWDGEDGLSRGEYYSNIGWTGKRDTLNNAACKHYTEKVDTVNTKNHHFASNDKYITYAFGSN